MMDDDDDIIVCKGANEEIDVNPWIEELMMSDDDEEQEDYDDERTCAQGVNEKLRNVLFKWRIDDGWRRIWGWWKKCVQGANEETNMYFWSEELIDDGDFWKKWKRNWWKKY